MRPITAILLTTLLHAGCAASADEPSPSATREPTAPGTPAARPSAAEPSVAATPVPNLQAGVMSEEGLFRASWVSRPDAPAINEVHEWVLHIETAAEQPAAGAIVTVNGDMPAHGHGMPTQPEVTADLGGGDYVVEGMAFQMGGYWIVDVTVTHDGETDLVRFGLDL